VYYDDNGKVPLLECVRRAETSLPKSPPRAAICHRRPARLRPRSASPCVRHGQCGGQGESGGHGAGAGGTGGLKIGADFLRRIAPDSQVWISEPSWENHRALFEGAGFTVNTYHTTIRLQAVWTLPA